MATFINEFIAFIVSYHHPKSGDKRIESGILWLWESNSRVLPYHRAWKLLALWHFSPEDKSSKNYLGREFLAESAWYPPRNYCQGREHISAYSMWHISSPKEMRALAHPLREPPHEMHNTAPECHLRDLVLFLDLNLHYYITIFKIVQRESLG